MVIFRQWLRGRRSFFSQTQADSLLNSTISSTLSMNLQQLSMLFSGIPELTKRTFSLKTGQKAAIVYMDGLVDKTSINTDILRPLMFHEWNEKDFWESSVSIGSVKKIEKWVDIEQALLNGKSILLIDKQIVALEIDTPGWPQRSIEEPSVESSLKGSHQGFTETASQNIALIRRYISSRELKIKECTIGLRSGTKLSILYLADVVNEDVIREIESRIHSLRIDTVLSTGELAELIEDNSYTPFPQLRVTERPDTVAHELLKGRAAVVVDRSPSVLIGPMNFSSFFHVIDDYNVRWILASFIRLLRFVAFFIAIFTPSIYIAMISFHYEVIPLKLLLTLEQSREKIPFPPLLEAMFMELVLEMLREAGIRLPAPVGQTVGVVGGIIIGQAAVQAGLVSNVMVIVVAVTAVASFIIPDLEMAGGIRIIRFPMMIISSLFGLIGIVLGMMIISIHLLSLESLGSPYSSPLSPLHVSDLKDTFIRLPQRFLNKRPLSVKPQQLKRSRTPRKVGGKNE